MSFLNPIKIESTVPADKINNMIDEISINDDMSISYEEYENRFRYTFSLNKKEEQDNYFFLNNLTRFVEEIIIRFYTDDIISETLDRKIGLVDDDKRFEILEDVKEVIKSSSLFIKEKKAIQKEIFEFFKENNTLIIDGYLNFRSKSFHGLIDKAIELVLGEFQLEVEYNEFIETLRLLIESQTSEVDLVNIVIIDNKYELLDSEFKEINNDHISIVLEDLYDDSVNDGDILLSTIIALSPNKIVMHLGDRKKDDVTYILEEVFEDNMEICRGCKDCDKL